MQYFPQVYSVIVNDERTDIEKTLVIMGIMLELDASNKGDVCL